MIIPEYKTDYYGNKQEYGTTYISFGSNGALSSYKRFPKSNEAKSFLLAISIP